jgi:lysozyme
MTLSDNGIKFITQWEGFSPIAYKDVAGYWTIGYGHLILPNEQHLMAATLTKQEAMSLKKKDAGIAEAAIRGQVLAPLNQNQFDALVSLIFNIGSAAFRDSTLKERINAYDTQERITEAWLRWNRAGGRFVQGLANRRKAEAELFFTDEKKKPTS